MAFDLNAYLRNRYWSRKAECHKLLGGKCVQCGSTDRLEIDHIDPKTKDFTVTTELSFLTWGKHIAGTQKVSAFM